MKAVIYSRFSTDRQNESSMDDQVRVCTELATREGWHIVERYEDQGISGAAFGNRPGFLAMRAAAMSGKFDVLLITDTTRLARSQELAPLVERFRFQGVRILGVQDAFDSASGTSDMQAGLSGIMSVEFRRMIKARTHAALENRAKDKRATGGRAYGYRDGKVDRGEAFIVREIFARFADGASARTIAAELNARRILAVLPRAAEEYRRQINLGLHGNDRAALKARTILRELFGGKIRLEPLPDGGLMAHWNLHTAALLRGVGTVGSGGVSWVSHTIEYVDVEMR